MTLKGTGNLPGNFGKTIFTKFGETYFRKILANFRKKFSHMINCQPTDLGGVLYTTELKEKPRILFCWKNYIKPFFMIALAFQS